MPECNIVRFSFAEVVVTVGGVVIEGFSKEANAIEVAYNEGGGPLDVAADGITALHSINADRSGTMQFRLNQASESSFYLLNLFTDIKGGRETGYVTSMVQDLNTGQVWRLAPSYVFNQADYVYGTEANIRQWTMQGTCLDSYGGGIYEIVAAGSL